MATWNDITGDPLVSRTLTKTGEENFDKIFGKKKTNGGWKPPLTPLSPTDTPTTVTEHEKDWDEKRIDIIGQNSNEGLHYEEEK
jgi:hypothetical protein